MAVAESAWAAVGGLPDDPATCGCAVHRRAWATPVAVTSQAFGPAVGAVVALMAARATPDRYHHQGSRGENCRACHLLLGGKAVQDHSFATDLQISLGYSECAGRDLVVLQGMNSRTESSAAYSPGRFPRKHQ